MLEILYQDEDLIAINKPHDLLVHQSPIARNAEVFAIQLLRDQIGRKVYPAHRLDRKTSGILLFTLEKECDKKLQLQFSNQEVKKVYHALVRGFTAAEGSIDYALKREEDGKIQEAVTHYKTLRYFEIPVVHGNFATSRYSLVEIYPETGRFHQIRKHFAHILHPIIGDRPHGCNKQNKLWKEQFQMTNMLLHAGEILFKHPKNELLLTITAAKSEVFNTVINLLEKNSLLK
ncbi:MAG: pseudouridylate synthase [Flavobacteriia bacterium]|nr:pseudouridylate synthase [Flavobacteriia bacterium]OJX39219.1 MAG: pseudouridylate synthase [Flavobacteriia bacterium 40-80]